MISLEVLVFPLWQFVSPLGKGLPGCRPQAPSFLVVIDFVWHNLINALRVSAKKISLLLLMSAIAGFSIAFLGGFTGFGVSKYERNRQNIAIISTHK